MFKLHCMSISLWPCRWGALYRNSTQALLTTSTRKIWPSLVRSAKNQTRKTRRTRRKRNRKTKTKMLKKDCWNKSVAQRYVLCRYFIPRFLCVRTKFCWPCFLIWVTRILKVMQLGAGVGWAWNKSWQDDCICLFVFFVFFFLHLGYLCLTNTSCSAQ